VRAEELQAPPNPPLTEEHWTVTALKGISGQFVNATPLELILTFHAPKKLPVTVQSTDPAPVTGAASGSDRLKFTVTGEVDGPVIPANAGNTNACFGEFEARMGRVGGPAKPRSPHTATAIGTVENMAKGPGSMSGLR
jgi:hypothetical protein